MNRTLQLLAAVLFLACTPSSPGAPMKKNTDWEGSVAAISDTSITVKNPKGTRVFAIYPGTVFGQRASKKLSDFKVGDTVHVVFSEVGAQAKAENIRNPEQDKKPAQKKGKQKK
jgi:Cu/Ag efflux protein CusF